MNEKLPALAAPLVLPLLVLSLAISTYIPVLGALMALASVVSMLRVLGQPFGWGPIFFVGFVMLVVSLFAAGVVTAIFGWSPGGGVLGQIMVLGALFIFTLAFGFVALFLARKTTHAAG